MSAVLRLLLLARPLALALAMALGLACVSSPVQASPPAAEGEQLDESTDFEAAGELYAPFLREHYYRLLARSPTKAFLWELALPGAGHVYNGFPIQAGIAIGLSALGSALWIAGAGRDSPPLWWAGMATFGVGRLYGLISSPITAMLLNAAYRSQFGIRERS